MIWKQLIMVQEEYPPPTIAPDYESLWDINTRGQEMWYRFDNWTGDWGNPALLEFRITPYVGLAYFDDTNDGNYRDSRPPVTTVENFNLVPPGTYPNLFDPTGNEIGNFMPAFPFVVDGTGLAGGTVILEMVSADHCHVMGASPIPGSNPLGIYFDLSAPPPPYVPALPQEEKLLSEYGKVFFYFWEAIDPVTSTVVANGYITPHCDTNDAAYWTNTGVNVALPNGAVADLYFNYIPGSSDNSHEIVLETGIFPSLVNFSHVVGGFTYNYEVELITYSTPGPSMSVLSLKIVP
ncbi:MAG TPA: hypothetical protein VKY82_05750 [Flavobacterium sp.]|nr:hypothetical protein [Flavobacterium sp.]